MSKMSKMSKMSDTCYLTEPPFHQCCCVCKHLVKLGDIATLDQIGWCCIVWLRMADNNPREAPATIYKTDQHGCGCEMFADNRKVKPKPELAMVPDDQIYG